MQHADLRFSGPGLEISLEALARMARWLKALRPLYFLFAVGLCTLPAFSQSAMENPWPDSNGPEVDVALVLAVDISYSMDLDEQALQRDGYIEAIRSRQVIDAIRNGLTGRIAITYVEWAGMHMRYVLADWSIIEDQKTADAFAEKLRAAPIQRGRRTSITGAILTSMEQLRKAPFRPIRRVIDISGDGPNNDGGLVSNVRDTAIASGVTINGLPIIMKRPWVSPYDLASLDNYYRDCVIGGPGSFMVVVTEREQFAPAIKSKILREVAQASQNDITAPPKPTADCQVGERQWRQNWERN